MVMLIWFLAANTALAVLYAAVKGFRRGSVALAVFFIFLPGLGFILYFLPMLFRTFMKNAGVDREAVLTHAFEIERQPEHPDVKEALDVVPVEDAMAISANAEKRALLLDQLKKSLTENYKILLAAQQDEDSESAHYVAAAKMEIYRIQQARWMECRLDLEDDPTDPKHYHTACTVLMEMLESGVLSAREQSAYRRRLCDLVEERIATDEAEVSLQEYEACLSSLVELERYEDAERFWQMHADRMRNEDAYRDMMKMFYQKGDRAQFEEILDDLRKNRQVRLSSQGLEQLRYWAMRLAETCSEQTRSEDVASDLIPLRVVDGFSLRYTE